MIDPNKCEFEESCKTLDGTVFYFEYPKDMEETEFYPERDYGDVVNMCVSIIVGDDGVYCVQMSPTVRTEYKGNVMLSDVDWRDLYPDVNYTDPMIIQLLKKAIGDV